VATTYKIHPDSPQPRRIKKIRDAIADGAVMLYPTDTVYAIGCDLQAKAAIKRVRQIKQLSNQKPLTFLCSSLSNIATYAQVSDPAYRIIKHLIPGPYTFLLPATKLVPKLVMNPKRRTTGIRVPHHPICMALIEALGNPVISTSALSVACLDDEYCRVELSRTELFDQLAPLVDVIVDDESDMGYRVSSILDVTGEEPIVIRQGVNWETAVNWGAVLPTPIS